MKMRLHIVPSRAISEIQREFNNIFPFLKLEFFHHRLFSRPDYSAIQLISPTQKIASAQVNITDGDFEINQEMKVEELERILKDDFSLLAQVFRKSGNLWLETTMTDSWSLQQQNYHGQELSTAENTNAEIQDYDLSRDADH